MNGTRIAVFSASWALAPHGEMATAVRSIAGALTRHAHVDVFVPGRGAGSPDGAFDLTPVGAASGATWPDAGATDIASGEYRAALVEAGDDGARALAATIAPGAPVLSVGRGAGVDGGGGGDAPVLGVDLPREDEHTPQVHHVGLYARVDPAASRRRHYGLRSVPGYLLVLGDRTGPPQGQWPSAQMRWVLARFARSYVAVVEGGVARVWRSRSCVAEFEVHTRMDLWILMARSDAVVDLLPGSLFARECVQALRYGVPIAVPRDSAAGGLARSGGGVEFSSTGELLASIETLQDPSARATLGTEGKAIADRWYGDPDGLVTRMSGVLGTLESAGGRNG